MQSNLNDDDDFGAEFAGKRRSGGKRSFGELDDDEDDIFESKKVKTKLEEMAPGVATGMILSLRESLEKSKDDLENCKMELETVKSEIQKWHSTFRNESFIPAGSNPEPKMAVNYALTLRSSEKSLKEQLEKAKKKEAAFIVSYAKREQEVAELKAAIRELRAQLKPLSMQTRRFLLDPAIHEEFTRLKNLVEEKEKTVKELQDNINAVNFQPNSKMGKQLIARCKTLQEENEEIGNQASEGKVKELSMKLASQKSRNAELRNQLEGLCKNVQVLVTDAERSNEMVVLLQQNLEERDTEINRLRSELQQRNVVEQEQEITDAALIVNNERDADPIINDEQGSAPIINEEYVSTEAVELAEAEQT